MPRPPSDADREFAVRLRALGLVDATPESVQTLREIGLLPAPTRTYPGGGGSSGRYPSNLVERAREALVLAKTYHRELHVAVAIMYARGEYSISENKLKRALLRVLDRYQTELLAAAEDASQAASSDEIAVNAGITLARRIERDPEFAEQRRRIPRSKARPKRAVLETVTTGMVQAQLTDEAPPADAIDEILRIVGAHDVFGASVASELADLAEPEDFSNFRLGDIVSATKQANLAQLERARDGALAQMEHYRTIAAAVQHVYASSNGATLNFPITDEVTVFAALANLASLFNDPDAYEEEINDTRDQTEFLNALIHLAQFLPPEFRPLTYLDTPMHEEELTTGQQARIQVLKLKYARHIPTMPACCIYNCTNRNRPRDRWNGPGAWHTKGLVFVCSLSVPSRPTAASVSPTATGSSSTSTADT